MTFGCGIPANSQANRDVLVLGYLWFNGFFKITGFAVMDRDKSQDKMKMEEGRSTMENSTTNKNLFIVLMLLHDIILVMYTILFLYTEMNVKISRKNSHLYVPNI